MLTCFGLTPSDPPFSGPVSLILFAGAHACLNAAVPALNFVDGGDSLPITGFVRVSSLIEGNIYGSPDQTISTDQGAHFSGGFTGIAQFTASIYDDDQVYADEMSYQASFTITNQRDSGNLDVQPGVLEFGFEGLFLKDPFLSISTVVTLVGGTNKEIRIFERLVADYDYTTGTLTFTNLDAFVVKDVPVTFNVWFETVAAPVPESSTYAVLTGLGALGFVLQRRRVRA